MYIWSTTAVSLQPGQNHDYHRMGSGNRIATWLFYESDVEQGGATVFPVLGVGVRPVKGSAVFWHNLLRNGDGDTRTKHAACPVLVGNKWGEALESTRYQHYSTLRNSFLT
jgi:hypothetical protein